MSVASCLEIMKSWLRERSSVLTKIGEASTQLELKSKFNDFIRNDFKKKLFARRDCSAKSNFLLTFMSAESDG